MSRCALIIGINHYPSAPLGGCINDALRISALLRVNEDNSPNFSCKLVTSDNTKIDRNEMLRLVAELFSKETDISLLDLSGHGASNTLGGYLITQGAASINEGVSMTDILTHATMSKARHVVIILDCCFSGNIGQLPIFGDQNNITLLRTGVSILTACNSYEPAMENITGGVFTSLLCDALGGGAADIIGKVSLSSIYAYVDETLDPWQQRPLFKSNVTTFISIRNCHPVIPLDKLRQLTIHFPTPDFEFSLDPSYEDTTVGYNPTNSIIFKVLQKYCSSRLLVPIGEEHMYYAAINSKSCKLTHLGKFYWKLVNNNRI